MTGRGLGFCAGYDLPGYMQSGFGGRRGGYGGYPVYGRGMRRGGGYGPGRGFRFRREPVYWQEPPVRPYEDESSFLKDQEQILRTELDLIQQRLSNLEGQDDTSGSTD
jgi:hypothetical protein